MKTELLEKIKDVLIIECVNDISEDFINDTVADDRRSFDDAFTGWADSNVDIYYYDIKQFIINNIEEVEDAINEFGWDGCGSDLHKAGQMAQFLMYERQLNEDFEAIKNNIAIDYLEEVLTDEQAKQLIEREDIDDLINDLDAALLNIEEYCNISDIKSVCDELIDNINESEE